MNNLPALIDLHVEMYKRRDFSLFTDVNDVRHQKQYQALELLTSELFDDIGFGGGAGGSKSFTGCYWETMNCILYPETYWFVCREELGQLRVSTTETFQKVWKKLGLKDAPKYNDRDHVWIFSNGSKIFYIAGNLEPKDPLFERFGSRELTGGWFEEAGSLTEMCITTLISRTGRQNNDKYNLRKKTFSTFNPNKKYIYTRYYKPYKDNNLPKGRYFLPSLVTDNPFIPNDYIENLKSLTSKVQKERLLYGNFDYDDDPNKLMEYDNILNLWTNEFVPEGEKYITADIALKGSDRLVIRVWSGFRVIKTYVENKSDPKNIEEKIRVLSVLHKVPRSNICFDADGVGAYLGSYLDGAKPFNNGSKTLNGENYENLKTQCYFKMAESINNNEVFIVDRQFRDETIEELEQIKQRDADKDGKIRLVPKDKIKEIIGRSPDFADSLMLRWFFELNKGKTVGFKKRAIVQNL